MESMSDNKRIINGLIWKGLERFGVLGVQFIIQIILARLLSPNDYGVLALMMIFVSVANILVQNGLNTALIQNKEVTEDDYSYVFWFSFLIACGIYIIIFISSPLIGRLYDHDNIVFPLRCLALMLLPASLNSIQLARVSRQMQFRKIFFSNLAGAVTSGVIGILLAYKGAGLYALVAQSLSNVMAVCIVMRATSGLRIRLKFDFERVKVFFSFGWKLAVSSILNTITENIRSMSIGLKFDAAALGYYERGMQFPQYGINVIQGTVQSVMLPAMSENQDNKTEAKRIMKNAISISAYLVFPMLAGMAAVAKSFIGLLLTDKWMASVPYMQIYCIIFAFYPIHVSNLQAMNSVGRSDLYLKLEIIKQVYGLVFLAVVLVLAKTPLFIAISGVALIPLGWFVNSFYNKELIGYSFGEQVKDVMPSLLMSTTMFLIVMSMNFIGMGYLKTLIAQIIVGLVVYLMMSIITRNREFIKLLRFAKEAVHRDRR